MAAPDHWRGATTLQRHERVHFWRAAGRCIWPIGRASGTALRAIGAPSLILVFSLLGGWQPALHTAQRPAAHFYPQPALPPCIDGQYAPFDAGTRCTVTANTTPTAL